MAVDSEQDKSLLKHLVPLNALSDEQLNQVSSRVTIGQAKNGDMLFREGDNDRRHIFLLQGQVKLLSGTREVDLVKGGGQNARFALAHQLPRKFSGQAVGDVRFAYIDSDLLHNLVISNTQSKTNKEEDANTDWMTLVLRARVLQQVPPANIQNVLRRMEEIQVKNGDVIIKQGDAADYFYVIARGTGVVTRKDPGGDRQLAVLAQGDAFGEDALVSGGVRAATVSMACDGTLMRLNKDDFSDLIRRPLVQGIRMDKARPLVKQGAIWMDIRHPEEYAADHLPSAINLPLENLRERYTAYPKEQKYIVYGPPSESAVGTFLLRERGFDVFMLEGWVQEQESGLSSDSGMAAAPSLAADSSPGGKSSQQKGQDLEQQLARYQKMLSQQVAEIRKLQNKLQEAVTENKKLEQALAQARESKAIAGDVGPLKQRIEELEREVNKLREELEMAQEVLQEASAQESTQNWEQVRILTKLERAEKDLAEQYEINRMLREENESIAKRLKG